MQAIRQMGGGLIIGIVSLLLVIGGVALSLSETASTIADTPSPLPPPTQVPELFAPTPTILIILSTETPTVIPTNTVVPPTACSIAVPAGWVQITLSTNDTLYTVAERYKTTADQLSAVNCLPDSNPSAGSFLYVPPVPTVTVIPCGPFAGWVKTHRVQSGDNLFRIALSYGISYPQLQRANCMGSSTTIYAGQLLWVPNVPTLTPAVTSTRTSTSVPPTNTSDFSTPTNLPTVTQDFSTPTQTFIVTSTPLPTSTPQPTSTTVATPTITQFPTNTSSAP